MTSCFAQRSKSESTPTSVLNEPSRAFKERDFFRAAALARAAIALQSDRVEAWNLLAVTTEAAGRTDDAATVYERGIASTHGSPILRNNFATLLTKIGDRATAQSQLEQALA